MDRVPHAGIPKGRHPGGPLFFPVVLLIAGCTAAVPVAERVPALTTSPLAVYRESGMLTGPGAFPVVASFVTLAGPSDSTLLIVGLSIPNHALRFMREGDGFAAAYGVALELTTTDSLTRVRREWRETVRVTSFAETTRSDESVVFQQWVALAPGGYVAELTAGDRNSSRGFRATDTLEVPAFEHDTRPQSAPVIVYRAHGRTHRSAPPEILLNPRRTVAYGGDAPGIYLESYALHDGTAAVRVRDAAESIVWESIATFSQDSGSVRHATITIPIDELPPGRLSVEVQQADGPARQRVPLLVTVSDEWMVANYEEVLEVVGYIGTDAELDSLRIADPGQRRIRWEHFWETRDPFPATSGNEFRQEFFARVRTATLQFSEPRGEPGWRTARGEVYIVLGPPDRVTERYLGSSDTGMQPAALEWLYGSLGGRRLSLLFLDRSGLGRYELEASSAVAFRAAARRLARPNS